MKQIYFDYAATTPCDPLVATAMEPYLNEVFGNPSSMHSFGQQARKALEESREKVSSFLGSASPSEIIFTSGGTESDNSAIIGTAFAMREKGRHIITSSIEHHAVLEACKFLEKSGFKVTYAKVDGKGMVDPLEIKKNITPETVLISVMHANNEVGTIQPIMEIGRIARDNGVYFHTDAVQTAGHIPVDVEKMNVSLLSVSGHKLYGPKGVGALYIRKGTRIQSYLRGGDQESGRRASTHNLPAIVGMAKAMELCSLNMEKEAEEQAALRDKIIKIITGSIDETYLNGHPQQRLPNNVNISIKYIEGESMLLSLDALGIAVSTGSACTSSSLEPSHVLLGMGLTHDLAHSSLRITLGRWTKSEEVDYLLDNLPKVAEKLRAMSPIYKKN